MRLGQCMTGSNQDVRQKKNKTWKSQKMLMAKLRNADSQKQWHKWDISPCYTWFHTPPACGLATGTQTPCWAAQERTPSPWGYTGAYRQRSPAGSTPASTHAAAEAWTPVPEEPTPPSGGCATTAGHDVMNRKHDSACVESDPCPAEERQKLNLFWKHMLPRNNVDFFFFYFFGRFFVLFFSIIKCELTKK